MLAMHLYPRRDEEEDEQREEAGEGGDRGLLQDGIEGVPRVLTTDQVRGLSFIQTGNVGERSADCFRTSVLFVGRCLSHQEDK